MKIETRTIDQISQENKELLEKLRYNAQCIRLKKQEMQEEKESKKFQEILNKNRKTFAFSLKSEKDTLDIAEINKFINEFFLNLHISIKKIIILNKFLYVSTKQNLKFNQPTIILHDTYVLEQVNPHSLIKLQNPI